MLLGIDHIVIVVNNLDAAIEDYRRLGFTVVKGGKHPVGTYNGLTPFADGSYIELISFYRDNPDHRWWAALKKGEGLVDFCMRTDDLRGDTEKFRAAGVDMNDPVPWARIRPDGYELKWRLSLAIGHHRGVAPFLIEDITPREERVPQNVDHTNGAEGIGTVLVAVDDLPLVARWYEAAVDAKGKPIERGDVGATGVRFAVGPHRVEVLTPSSASGLVSEWLQHHGPSPFAATLCAGKKTAPRASHLTHGAALRFED
jgi:catechol 2,3-dioxygenase-like lactoylglutathione lyase family enzyme